MRVKQQKKHFKNIPVYASVQCCMYCNISVEAILTMSADIRHHTYCTYLNRASDF